MHNRASQSISPSLIVTSLLPVPGWRGGGAKRKEKGDWQEKSRLHPSSSLIYTWVKGGLVSGFSPSTVSSGWWQAVWSLRPRRPTTRRDLDHVSIGEVNLTLQAASSRATAPTRAARCTRRHNATPEDVCLTSFCRFPRRRRLSGGGVCFLNAFHTGATRISEKKSPNSARLPSDRVPLWRSLWCLVGNRRTGLTCSGSASRLLALLTLPKRLQQSGLLRVPAKFHNSTDKPHRRSWKPTDWESVSVRLPMESNTTMWWSLLSSDLPISTFSKPVSPSFDTSRRTRTYKSIYPVR